MGWVGEAEKIERRGAIETKIPKQANYYVIKAVLENPHRILIVLLTASCSKPEGSAEKHYAEELLEELNPNGLLE